jgi:hypothetical protein
MFVSCADISYNIGEGTVDSYANLDTVITIKSIETHNIIETTATKTESDAPITLHPQPWRYNSVIFSYPQNMPAEDIYNDVKKGGWVVLHNSFMMAGEELWNEFYDKVMAKEPASVLIAKYSTPNGRIQYSEETLKTYPKIFLMQIDYDGFTFKQITRYSIHDYADSQGEYSFLIKYAGTVDSKSAMMRYEEVYHLVNDKSMTYDEIQKAMSLGLYIPDAKEVFSVISDIKDEYTHLIPNE